MPDPYLIFCPYLPLPPTDNPVKFADWELGPLQSLEDRWAYPEFETQAKAFLGKFVGKDDEPINNPALLCRKGKLLDGQGLSRNELKALELSLAFAFIDRNPRLLPENRHKGWGTVTTDNVELYAWPIDLEQGNVTTNFGYLVRSTTGGYRISDTELLLRPPVDLRLPFGAPSPDPLLLTGIYETVLGSIPAPRKDRDADKIRTALEWFAKAWRNTSTLHFPERLVFLKTAFEALTGTSDTWKCAKRLREIFEALPHTTEWDSAILVWSPKEEPVCIRTRRDKEGRLHTEHITDLMDWFIEFAKTRNKIIHKGKLELLPYSRPNSAYNGEFFFTAEFLLRGLIKLFLSTKPGYEDVWRSEL